MRLRNWLISFVTYAVVVSTAQALVTKPPKAVTEILEQQGISENSLSIFVQDVRKNVPELSFNAHIPRNPASTIKLLTTFIALDTLGPAYTWETKAYIQGDLRDGHLNGNLILKGQGDPFLVTEYLWTLLRGLREYRGVKVIAGDLIIDNSYFKTELQDPAEFDGQPYRAYNALPDAVLVNFLSIRFSFLPNKQTKSVRIVADPWPANLKIINQLRLTGGACRGHQYNLRMRVSNHSMVNKVTFAGDYPAACGSHSRNRVILKPADMVYGVFKRLWRELGGTHEGTMRVSSLPREAKLVHLIESRPLAELIRGMNKFSNNVMTRQLLLTLAAEHYGPPGTVVKGRKVVEKWLDTNGLSFPELVLDNGAGLSRDTRISAKSLGRFLVRAYHSPFMPEFVSSLPISAIDGTLSDRFRNEPLAGRLHMKTGSLNGVSAIAGYLLSRTGRMFVVVSLQNTPRIQRGVGKAIQDALSRWVYER